MFRLALFRSGSWIFEDFTGPLQLGKRIVQLVSLRPNESLFFSVRKFEK